MNTVLAFVPQMQFLDVDGNPYSSGRVQYFDATTSAPKAVYSDRAGTIAHTEIELDAGGSPVYGGIWYGEGTYKVVVQKLLSPVGPTYQTVYTVDNVDGAATAPIGSQRVLFIEAVVNLPSIDSSEWDAVWCAGYYAAGDGGGGQFIWNGTTAAPYDGGIVIKPTSNPAIGAWLRNVPAGEIPAAYWGYLSKLPAEAMESRLVAAHTFCSNYERVLLLQCGKTAIGHASSVTLTGGFIHIEAGYHIQRMASGPALVNLTFQDVDLTINGRQTLTKDIHTAEVVINCKMPVIYPEWWGADPYGANDSYFAVYWASVTSNYGGGVEIAFNGHYIVTGVGYTVVNLELKNISITETSWIDQTVGIKLHKVSTPQQVTEIFRAPLWDFSKWDCSACEKTYAEWFLQGNPTAQQIIDMCKTVVPDPISSPTGTIYWNYGGIWNLPEVPDDDSCRRVTHIPEATRWASNGNTMQLANGVLYARYWGNVLTTAIIMAGRNKAWLDGENYRFYLGLLNTANCINPLKMRNMWLDSFSPFDVNGPGLILRDSFIENTLITSSSNAWVADFQNCQFQGGDGYNFGLSASTLTIKGCTIAGFDYVNTEPALTGIITGNVIKDIAHQVSHNGAVDGGVIIQGNVYQNLNGNGENPSGNLLPPYAIILKTPSNLNFSDNNINMLYPEYHVGTIEQSILLINGNDTNTWVANKLIVKNNTIDNEAGAYPIAETWGIRVQGFADYGHVADISENLATRIGTEYHMDMTKATGFDQLYLASSVFGPITFGAIATVSLPYQALAADFSVNIIQVEGRYAVIYSNDAPPVFTALGGGKSQVQFSSVISADIFPLRVDHRVSINVSGYIGAYN